MFKLIIRFALHGQTVEREALCPSFPIAHKWAKLLMEDGYTVTIAAAGTIPVQGALAVTLGALSINAVGTLTAGGVLDRTLGGTGRCRPRRNRPRSDRTCR